MRTSSFIKKYTLFVLCLISASLLSSCANSIASSKLMTVSIDMDKQQVLGKLGNPAVLRGSIKNKYNQVIEVWEYQIDKGKSGEQVRREWTATLLTVGLCAPILLSEGTVETYWLYFCDGKLVKWGQASDWKREADIIYDINFNNAPSLTY